MDPPGDTYQGLGLTHPWVEPIAEISPGETWGYSLAGSVEIPKDANAPGYWICARVDPVNQVMESN